MPDGMAPFPKGVQGMIDTPRRNRRRKHIAVGITALVTTLGLVLLRVPLSAQNDVNVIESIRTVKTATASGTVEMVEITVSSTRDFRVGALPNVLRLGNREYAISRSPDTGPDTGTLKKLIFSVAADDFRSEQTIPNGARVIVQYGTGDGGGDPRDFGALNKNLLDK
jgi:hypothetical protein